MVRSKKAVEDEGGYIYIYIYMYMYMCVGVVV